MRSDKLAKLLKYYEKCPNCGSEKVNITDAVRVGVDSFTRNCECGFSITVDEDNLER